MNDERHRDTIRDLTPAPVESWEAVWTATRIDIKPAPPVRPDSVEADDGDFTLPDVPALEDTRHD